MADCEFCGSGVDVEAQDMGEGRVMLLCASCRANIVAGKERDKETMAREIGEQLWAALARWWRWLWSSEPLDRRGDDPAAW